MPPRKKQRSSAAIAAASSGAAAVVSQPPPPHTRLYANVLGATFDFLTFDELRAAMMTCRSWLAAAYAMRGLTDGKVVSSCRDVAPLLQAHLARHVCQLGGLDSLRLSPRQLLKALHAMPFLRDLAFAPLEELGWVRALRDLQLPPTLRVMEIRVSTVCKLLSVNAFIHMLGRHSLVRKVRLVFERSPRWPSSLLRSAAGGAAARDDQHRVPTIGDRQRNPAAATANPPAQCLQTRARAVHCADAAGAATDGGTAAALDGVTDMLAITRPCGRQSYFRPAACSAMPNTAAFQAFPHRGAERPCLPYAAAGPAEARVGFL